MSITDELREYAQIAFDKGSAGRARVETIADRIDREHRMAMEKVAAEAYLDGAPTEAQLEELGYIALPKDADGEVIHIGDRMENNERVVRIVLTDGSWEPSVYIEKLPNVLHEYFCDEISHYHAPTVEDVLREFHERMTELGTTDQCVGVERADAVEVLLRERAELVAEYAAKLTLRGDE